MTMTATKNGIRIKSRVKAGAGDCPGCGGNHNQAAKGLRVKSRVRAGGYMKKSGEL
jgi:hypothetical protein